MDLYTEAASVLEKFENKRGSVKSLVFASSYKNVRQLYALVCESLKYQPVLTTIFQGSHSLQQEETLQGQGHLATVLLYEHLVGKGLGRAGQLRKCILKHKNEIRERCDAMLEEKGVTSLADLLSSQCQTLNNLPIPRYARVNLLKTTVQEAITAFTAEGWDWRDTLNLQGFQREVEALGDSGFGRDPLLPDLLIFPPGTDLHDHPWVLGGCLALQDRASCFPAHVLNPSIGSTVLDCCAAPGNKTCHAASLMGNTGKIWACERDGKRMALLRQQLRKHGVDNVKTLHQDFLALDPLDERFADVEYILVDPSCSGSGMMNRMDHVNNNNATASSDTTARLASLQRFQISILKHALRFPHAHRVVYSTCSVHEEENEGVVREVAQQVGARFELKPVFPQFAHRGKGGDQAAKRCLRTTPEQDLTNGFFVACFERISVESSEKTENSCEAKSGNTDDSTFNGGTSVSPLKKKRKRKHVEEGEDTSAGCSGTDSNLLQNGEQEAEGCESPKKKKKKCKSKKKSVKQESEGAETIPAESSETQPCAEVSPRNESSISSKHKSSKPRNKEQRISLSESAQESNLPDNLVDVSGNRTASAKKKKKKKKDKKQREGDNSLSSQQPERGTVDEVKGEGLGKVKDKHGKKNRRQQENHEESPPTSATQGTGASPVCLSTDQTSLERKKKKKKKKKKED